MIELLVYVIVAFIVLGLIYYLITMLPLPAPFAMIVRIAFIIICILVVVGMFAPMLGHGPSLFRYG